MSKQITGTIVKRADGYQAFVRTQGEEFLVPLDTDDLAVAKLRKPEFVRKFLVNLGKRPTKKHKVAPVGITMSDVASKYYLSRKEMGVATWGDEERWWRLHCERLLGTFLPKSVTSTDVEDVLLQARDKGLSGKSLRHIFFEVGHVLLAARKQGLLTGNVCEMVTMPRVAPRRKKRITLTDEEFVRYVQHPDTLVYSLVANIERKAGGQPEIISREIKVLAILARVIGGARASDLHAMTWEHIDTHTWRTITVPRPKVSAESEETKEDRYYIPEAVIPYLDQWHRDHGQPSTGPVFPAQRRLGPFAVTRRKVARSYASDLRRDLLAAGVDRYEVHHDTDKTKRTDFHSLRRAYVGALHRAGVPIRESMDLTSHVSESVHRRYDVETRLPMLTPPAIVPVLGPVPAQLPVNTETVLYDTIPSRNATIQHESSTIVECAAQSTQPVRYESTPTGDATPENYPASTGTYDAEQSDVGVIEAGQAAWLAANTKEVGRSGHGSAARAELMRVHRYVQSRVPGL